jgi:Sphingosine kinase and enzymes related to eukaryotic diacylglycerol kinase
MIDEGHSLIIVGGGDGTFHTITELFAHKEVILGILPLGTANNFARSLGIPMDLDKAVEVICNGNVVPVDLGVINNQYFINIASIGFSKQVINATPRRLKQYLGIIAYILYETKFLLTQELFDCTIKTDEKAEN